MSARQRPLSPHLQVYKPQLTAATSIGHRISGVLLCGFALVMSWGLIALAGGQGSYDAFMASMSGIPGRIMVAAAVVAFVYHFLNGIRHLAWDTGWGLDLKRAYATGYAVVCLTPVLSALVLWLLWG